MRHNHWTFILCAFVLLGWLLPSSATAQDLEPRRWTHLPVGTNSLAFGYTGNDADIYYNPLVGITDGTANSNAWLARYSYAFAWSGNTARVDAMLPYVSGTWRGLVGGKPSSRTIRTGGDPWLRLTVNLYGAPALSGEKFTEFIAANPVRTTVGASLAVSLPLGGYDKEEFINVGRNRYALRPQIGVLHIRGPWSLELAGSVFLYSDNKEFLDSLTLSQKPIFALQGHVIRNFGDNFWLGAGLAYAAGGKVDLDSVRTSYEVDNVLWNLTGGYRITKRQSVVLAWQQGRTQVDVGGDFDRWRLSWAIAWGR